MYLLVSMKNQMKPCWEGMLQYTSKEEKFNRIDDQNICTLCMNLFSSLTVHFFRLTCYVSAL